MKVVLDENAHFHPNFDESVPNRSTHKEHIYIHKVVAELVVLFNEKEDLVVQKIPREWVIVGNFNIVK